MLALIVLVATLGAVAYAWFLTEMALGWRLVVTAVAALSFFLQAAPPPQLNVVVPLLMQVTVVIWMAIRRRLD